MASAEAISDSRSGDDVSRACDPTSMTSASSGNSCGHSFAGTSAEGVVSIAAPGVEAATRTEADGDAGASTRGKSKWSGPGAEAGSGVVESGAVAMADSGVKSKAWSRSESGTGAVFGCEPGAISMSVSFGVSSGAVCEVEAVSEARADACACCLRCRCSCAVRMKVLEHWSQRKGHSPVCTLRRCERCKATVSKARSHSSQACALSRPCAACSWSYRSHRRAKLAPHCVQRTIRSRSWASACRLRLDAEEKLRSQRSQVWLSSPACRRRCSRSWRTVSICSLQVMTTQGKGEPRKCLRTRCATRVLGLGKSALHAAHRRVMGCPSNNRSSRPIWTKGKQNLVSQISE